MAQNENTNLPPEAGNARKAARNTGLHPLHEAALRIASLGRGKPSAKTRDLVAMLMGHGARAWRLTQPRASLHLHVRTPSGKHPLRLRIR
ncbi:hypothetical protein [Rhizobium alvei]|uniref:Transposase n=1 Tax=Rhizobium alvei TaxID=1132659 RepID=A0ABT8YQD4_9HYPH|nr:hypothetical protein [Rhizobium alvei]MDO6965846.1 hypothetical protein [Rhizobium alvei]